MTDTHHSPLDASWVSAVLGLPLPFQNPAASGFFLGISTDSRKIEPGYLFIPLKGETYDGHRFIQQALDSGAAGFLTEKRGEVLGSQSAFVFPVADCLQAFRKLAQAWREKFQIPVIAVVGSVGKTTTKEFLAAILQGKWPNRVLKTEGSQNGFVGIPITLFGLTADHQAAVIEVGIDEPGTMTQHMDRVRPTLSMVTAIGPEHLEKLVDLKTVAYEENLALLWTAKNGGISALNLDDRWISPMAGQLPSSRMIAFRLEIPHSAKPFSDQDVNRLVGCLDPNKQELTCQGMGLEMLVLNVPLPGVHNARNLLGAVAVARKLGLSGDEIKTGLEQFQGAEGRSEVRKLRNGVTVICDYYNSNPTSTFAALQSLSQISPSPGRKIVCLADMLELGSGEEAYHRELAKPLSAASIDVIYLFGKNMTFLKDELARTQFGGKFFHFSTRLQMISQLLSTVRPGDTILIKGSHNMKMEEVWQALVLAQGLA